ncbi:hypothetical protein T4E_10992, partial [Trichinella pseudospiralis]
LFLILASQIMNPAAAAGRSDDWNNADAEMLDVFANKEASMSSRNQVNNDESTSVEIFRDFFNEFEDLCDEDDLN